MKRLIIFLIRRRLGLKKGERFQFTNQKSTIDRYYFTSTKLMKEHHDKNQGYTRPSNVNLNYVLSDPCRYQIRKVEKENWC